MKYNLLCILGATATGKTHLAVEMARTLNSEIISADSRQVYRGMDLGTGKDLEEYGDIPYHLIDIHPAGYKYNVFEYQKDFCKTYKAIEAKGKLPILCGGSGLYIESALEDYKMQEVPPNESLRKELEDKSLGELIILLKSYKQELHNTTDTSTKKRTIRAIEIAEYDHQNPPKKSGLALNPLVVGIHFDVGKRRERITERLHNRLNNGMTEEVEQLLHSGISPEDLIYYGLEYKYLTLYLTAKIDYNTMFTQLNTAIHRFAKRQMTWFRRMERRGTPIHWIDGENSEQDKVAEICKIIS